MIYIHNVIVCCLPEALFNCLLHFSRFEQLLQYYSIFYTSYFLELIDDIDIFYPYSCLSIFNISGIFLLCRRRPCKVLLKGIHAIYIILCKWWKFAKSHVLKCKGGSESEQTHTFAQQRYSFSSHTSISNSINMIGKLKVFSRQYTKYVNRVTKVTCPIPSVHTKRWVERMN